jgi:class 3 adenylate cyclase/pimeloyl-ACP methyl ester carboxylesterase
MSSGFAGTNAWVNDAAVNVPETRYATTADGVSIAYQVVGSGPPDIVFINSAYISNVELVWEWAVAAPFLRGLASRGRLIPFDRRGTGLSDSVSGDRLPTLEARMDDIRAVMDSAGSDRSILLGFEDGAALSFLFAATYPDRVAALIAVHPASRGSWAPDAPWLSTEQEWAEYFDQVEASWGTPEFAQSLAETIFPSRANDPEFVRSYLRLVRHSVSKADAMAIERMWKDTDVRRVLPAIQAPTLVTHNPAIHDMPSAAEESRYIADHIPGAAFFQAESADDVSFEGALLPIDRFLASLREEEAQFDRSLATVLFTDIVGSTARAAAIGDADWHELLARHHSTIRAMLGRYRGREVDTAGDGFFATFDGPARAARCAGAIIEAVRPLGIEVRAGVHTGEVEMIDDKVAGIAIAIGARIGALAGPSEVLASSTVKNLTAGSGLVFEDAGRHELKGVPDRWHLYRIAG